MARMAWVENGIVTNFPEINPAQVPEFTREGIEIIDFEPLDVHEGDKYQDGAFWRNGELLSLPEDPIASEMPTESLTQDAAAALELLGVKVYE